MAGAYVPDRGDLVWLRFSPQAGREQAGHRPALVLTPKSYNRKTGLMIACPVTNQVKGYPFEVTLPDDLPIRGAVLADHVKSLDWRVRKAKRACAAPDATVQEVIAKTMALLT